MKTDSSTTANISIGDFVEPRDLELVFSGEAVAHYPDSSVSLGTVLKDLGLFPSRKAAKNNGWDRQIPWGFSEFTVGKLKTPVTIWKPSFGYCPVCVVDKWVEECKCNWDGQTCPCTGCHGK